MLRSIRYLSLSIAVLGLAACSTSQPQKDTVSRGTYKVGNPYQIMGKTYYPKVNYDYDETGIASWYGPGFNGKKTANGEIFYQNELTAAHKTLPMPSFVRVTNLENGKSLIARINDRGPYSHGRLIDMSSKGAELLGFKNRGTAKVRVQVLEKESKRIAQAAMSGQSTRGTEVAMNRNGYVPESLQATKVSAGQERYALNTKDHGVIPGHVTNGNFYPDPLLSKMPVTPTSIFVQAGSFTSRDNAVSLSNTLSDIGQTSIKQAQIDGKTFYRVRLAAKDVATADKILKAVVRNGNKNAIIVVE